MARDPLGSVDSPNLFQAWLSGPLFSTDVLGLCVGGCGTGGGGGGTISLPINKPCECGCDSRDFFLKMNEWAKTCKHVDWGSVDIDPETAPKARLFCDVVNKRGIRYAGCVPCPDGKCAYTSGAFDISFCCLNHTNSVNGRYSCGSEDCAGLMDHEIGHIWCWVHHPGWNCRREPDDDFEGCPSREECGRALLSCLNGRPASCHWVERCVECDFF